MTKDHVDWLALRRIRSKVSLTAVLWQPALHIWHVPWLLEFVRYQQAAALNQEH
jgi:hypothetical protein